MFPVFINRARINKDIVNINIGEVAERIENIIHNILEFTRSILKTKRHHIPLIMSKGSGKGNLIPILITDLDLLKSRFHVKLREYHSLT